MGKTVVAATTAAIVVGLLAAPASAAIRITKIYFDSPGKDTGTNQSLNEEFLVVKNTGTRTRRLGGWRLRDADGNVFRFIRLRVEAGDRVRIHTGRGRDRPHNLYWDFTHYVWDNSGDTATLKNRQRRVVDHCSYSGVGSRAIC
jgi:hypothetical protein